MTQSNDTEQNSSKPALELVDKIQKILQDKNCGLADTFGQLPGVQQARGQSPERQRIMINRELRLVLGAKEEDTSIARLALDDACEMQHYMRNFKRYVAPQL